MVNQEVRPHRRNKIIEVSAGPHTITAADPSPQTFDTLSTRSVTHAKPRTNFV